MLGDASDGLHGNAAGLASTFNEFQSDGLSTTEDHKKARKLHAGDNDIFNG
jgi:hypothetical protein